jgi:hypothetical protein
VGSSPRRVLHPTRMGMHVAIFFTCGSAQNQLEYFQVWVRDGNSNTSTSTRRGWV